MQEKKFNAVLEEYPPCVTVPTERYAELIRKETELDLIYDLVDRMNSYEFQPIVIKLRDIRSGKREEPEEDV